MVSPRKSRRKSACFSRTMTRTPARASRNPSIIPAGPPPIMTQRVSRIDVAAMFSFELRNRLIVPTLHNPQWNFLLFIHHSAWGIEELTTFGVLLDKYPYLLRP